jgi:hypothetical protein
MGEEVYAPLMRQPLAHRLRVRSDQKLLTENDACVTEVTSPSGYLG